MEQTPSELMSRQQPLVQFADAARKYAEENGISGFQKANIDNDEFAVVVVWHGPRSARFDDFVATTAKGFPVHVIDAPYTRLELMAEARRLLRANRGILDSAGPTSTLTGILVRVNVTKVPLSVALKSDYPIERIASGGIMPLGG